jgi:hypothetical protein
MLVIKARILLYFLKGTYKTIMSKTLEEATLKGFISQENFTVQVSSTNK